MARQEEQRPAAPTNKTHLTLPVVTDADRTRARAGRSDWDAADDLGYDILITLSGKDYEEAHRALLRVVATLIQVAAPNHAEAGHGAKLWGGDLVKDMVARAHFFGNAGRA
jgi:hypothetical protein